MFIPDKMVLKLGQFPASEGRKVQLLLIVDEKELAEPSDHQSRCRSTVSETSLEPLGTFTGTVHRYAVEIAVPPGRPHVQKTEQKRGHITIHTNHPSKEPHSHRSPDALALNCRHAGLLRTGSLHFLVDEPKKAETPDRMSQPEFLSSATIVTSSEFSQCLR